MNDKKCINCRKIIAEKAVICTECGTNQKTGRQLMAGEKSSFRYILILFLIACSIAAGAFYYKPLFKAAKQQAQKHAPQLTQNITQKLASTFDLDNNIEKSSQPKIYNETRHFSDDLSEPIKESIYADRYSIKTALGVASRLDRSSIPYKIKNVSLRFNIRVSVPKDSKTPLRLKVYCGTNSNGQYKLIYDQTAKAKLQSLPNPYEGRLKKIMELPPRMKNAPERIKKKFMEHRKRLYARILKRKKYYDKLPATYCALFSYKNAKLDVETGQRDLYLRTLLCDADGNVIKEDKPLRHQLPLPSATRLRGPHDPSVVYGGSSKLPSMDRDIIYPYYFDRTRKLIFAFKGEKAFKVKSFSIDGIEYEPVFTQVDYKTSYRSPAKLIRRNGKRIVQKKAKVKSYYRSSMNLAYPFGGTAKLTFNYKTASGRFKNASFSFYLAPPPPVFNLATSSAGTAVKISWDNVDKGLDKSNFYELPKLVITKNQRELKSFPVYKQNSYTDKGVFRGEPLKYNLLFKGGIFKMAMWSSEKGAGTYKLKYTQLRNPFLEYGKSITIPMPSEKPHPVRIELLNSMLCYENTGIKACNLLKTVIDTVSQEKDMVFYDRDSRNYILDEKYFALSSSLKKQFVMKEADYAVQIKDYSRQNGNGLELWLFKKRVEGQYARKSTIYWRVADIKINANAKDLSEAVKKLISKIRSTLEFKTCADTRSKTIKPANVICPPFRPVNQKFVVWNYEAICESLFLSLGSLSNTIKILSRADWDKVFNERILGHSEGYSYINEAVREVLLTGRLWRNGKSRSYYIQACDAFTGEVLGCRIFSGKTRDVATELAQWVSEFRLSNDIKVDFHLSKFHAKSVRSSGPRPWQPRNDLLKNFGPYIAADKNSWVARRRRKQVYNGIRSKNSNVTDNNFYTFVKRQWNDGFRNKAISMLEKKWKSSRTIKVGMLLSDYYAQAKRNRDALAVYDVLLQMDDCPKEVYKKYNPLRYDKDSTSQQVVKAPPRKRDTYKNTVNGNIIGTTKLSNAIDYSSTYTNFRTKKVTKYQRTHVSNSNAIEKNYFIDRDRIYPDWATGEPCRTAKLILGYQKPLLSLAINDPDTIKHGIWTAAFRHASERTYLLEYFFRQWRYLNGRKYKMPFSAPSRSENLFSPMIFVAEGGWNSVNPFGYNKLNKRTIYTRLGYFFTLYPNQSNLLNHIYHYSKVRAFFELKKKPMMQFPVFKYAPPRITRALTARLRTSKDIIRLLATEVLTANYMSDKNSKRFQYGRLKLISLLALDYTATHSSEPEMLRIFRKIYAYKVPTTIKGYQQAPLNIDFLIYKAYKKDRRAIKMLKLLISKQGYFSRYNIADYIYTLAQAGQVELIKLMQPYSKLEQSTLRWLPSKILKQISGDYLYLIFGTRNDSATRKWFLKHNREELINQYYGKPPVEAYQEWRSDHMAQVKALKQSISEGQ